MAQEHDLFDDIIEISKGFDFLKNPLGGVTDALDPSAPQVESCRLQGERPRGNTIPVPDLQNEKSGLHRVHGRARSTLSRSRKTPLRSSTPVVRGRLAPLPTDRGDHLAAPAPKTCMTISSLLLRATRPPTSPARAPLSVCRAKTRWSSLPAWAILRPRLAWCWLTIPT